MSRHLSAQNKIDLINKVKAGQKITKIAVENRVSRTSVYKWLDLYDKSVKIGKKVDFKSKIKRGSAHWKSLKPANKRKIKKYALENPLLSPQEISRIINISHNGVWKILKKSNLSTQKARLAHLDLMGKALYRKFLAEEKLQIIREVRSGQKVSVICKKSHISRTIFYKWNTEYMLNQSDSRLFRSKHPRGESHWRYHHGAEEIIRNMVLRHPEFSAHTISRIMSKKDQQMSHNGVHKVLVRLALNTYRKRLSFVFNYKKTNSHPSSDQVITPKSTANQAQFPQPPPFFRHYLNILLLIVIILPLLAITIFNFLPNYMFLPVKPQPHKNISSKISKLNNPAKKVYPEAQNMALGLLALDMNKSNLYSDESVKFSIGVLNSHGSTICNADLILTITDPQNHTKELATKNNTILKSPDCHGNGFNKNPDYTADYKTSTKGEYAMELTAVAEGKHFQEDDNFVVGNSAYDIERTAPSRIYPGSMYESSLTVVANRTYEGIVTERIPKKLGLISSFPVGSVSQDSKSSLLEWDVDWKKGHTYTLTYDLTFPAYSPTFYLIGPLQIGSFHEKRAWQIAADHL